MTFQDYLTQCNEQEGDSRNLPGESYLKVLQDKRPDIASHVTGMFLDPRLHPDRIGDFLYFVQVSW